MSRSRMWFVSGFLCFIVTGHLIDAWRQDDHWPFAAYPMFARVNKPEPFTAQELWGVRPDGTEIPITSKMTGVMGINRVRPSLMRLHLLGKRAGAKHADAAEDAMEDLLDVYERHRERKALPKLIGLKFYELRWDFDWWARNRDAPQRTVLVETDESPTSHVPETQTAKTKD